jgi:hypothetical protein
MAAPMFVTRIADAKQYDRITEFLYGFSQEKKRLVSKTIIANREFRMVTGSC